MDDGWQDLDSAARARSVTESELLDGLVAAHFPQDPGHVLTRASSSCVQSVEAGVGELTAGCVVVALLPAWEGGDVCRCWFSAFGG